MKDTALQSKIVTTTITTIQKTLHTVEEQIVRVATCLLNVNARLDNNEKVIEKLITGLENITTGNMEAAKVTVQEARTLYNLMKTPLG